MVIWIEDFSPFNISFLMLFPIRVLCQIRAMITLKEVNTPELKTVRMNKETKPAHELLLAQLVLSAIIIGLLSHATYEKFLHIPVYILELQEETPVFRPSRIKDVYINQFRVPHAILFQLTVSSGYFFVNLLLYITNKIMKEPILNSTILILMQDVVFCILMFACSIAAVAHQGGVSSDFREIEILIASGISMFCCVSSGVGVYYSYRVYKGL